MYEHEGLERRDSRVGTQCQWVLSGLRFWYMLHAESFVVLDRFSSSVQDVVK